MIESKTRLQIRNNSKVILGLTGLIGSGCTTLAKMLADDFVPRLKHYTKSYNANERSIVNIFTSMNKLKRMQQNISAGNKLKIKNGELKKALEKREIINIINRNETDLIKNKFLYISFSAMIIFYIVRYFNDCSDIEVADIVKRTLKKIGYTVEESIELTKTFLKPYRALKKHKFKRERLIGLFSGFNNIRDEIVKYRGKELLQDLGDKVRQYGTPFLIDKTKRRHKFTGRWLASIVDRYIHLCSEYKYFVLESFRNPQELYYFREKYSYFYLIAIGAEKKSRLKWTGLKKDEFEKIEEREAEPIHKTDVCELDVDQCIDIADIVIRNSSNKNELFIKLLRYTAMILEPGSIKPTEDETKMHIAYTLSVRSNCLSRQVGAVIVNPDGYIIGAGWNDVGEGQLSCGIKQGKDYNNRYLKNTNIKISPDEQNRYICIKKKYMDTQEQNDKKSGESDYCPVLHAEENAILQLAKYYSGGTQNGTMYSTTFPCTGCLKKISQVGINKIVFSEKYINPLVELYKQSIKNIQLIPFEGVKSYSYSKLFKPYYNKKEQQIYFNS